VVPAERGSRSIPADRCCWRNNQRSVRGRYKARQNVSCAFPTEVAQLSAERSGGNRSGVRLLNGWNDEVTHNRFAFDDKLRHFGNEGSFRRVCDWLAGRSKCRQIQI